MAATATRIELAERRRSWVIPTALKFNLCPGAGCDGGDAFGVLHEAVPGVAAGIEDGVVGAPYGHAELVATQVFPHVLHGVQLRRIRRQPPKGDVFRHAQPPSGPVPAGAG